MTLSGPDVASRRLDGARLDGEVGPLLGPVLARLVGGLAARAELPLDRVEDAVLIAEALASAAQIEVADGRLALRIDSSPGALHVRVGPLSAGGAERIIAAAHAGEAGDVLRTLADRVKVSTQQRRGEHLAIELHADDPRGPR